MVSTASIVCIYVSLFLSLLLPIIVLLILQKGRKGVFGIWLAGVLGFAVPQLFIHVPALQILGMLPAYKQFINDYPILYVLALALTAGLFETAGRLVVLRFALSKKLSYMTGLVAGAGHGGIEAITIVGLSYINNLVIIRLINSGIQSPIISESIRQALVNTQPYMFLMAGLERVFTMMFHIALTVILTLFILKKHTVLGFFVVTFIHFAFDSSAVFMQMKGLPILITEAVIFVVAAASLIFVIKIRPFFGDKLSIPVNKEEPDLKEEN